jgi:hypothetical protein
MDTVCTNLQVRLDGSLGDPVITYSEGPGVGK